MLLWEGIPFLWAARDVFSYIVKIVIILNNFVLEILIVLCKFELNIIRAPVRRVNNDGIDIR